MEQIVHTRWNCWNEEALSLSFPADWYIQNYDLPEADKVSLDEIRQKIAKRIKDFSEKIEEKSTVCILVDDMTRPTYWGDVLEIMSEQLKQLGIIRSNITILFSLAGHEFLSNDEIKTKLGSKVSNEISIQQHGPESEYVWINYANKKVGINKVYHDADIKIVLGTILPHPFAGYSGGAKAVMPGIADLASIKRNHFMIAFGKGKVCDLNNSIRKQMDDIAKLVGIDLLANVVTDANRNIVGLFIGELDAAYHEGVLFAQSHYSSVVKHEHNVVILNAYPKDRELLQVSNAFNVINTLPLEKKQNIEVVVMIAKCSKHLGYHALFGPNGSLYKDPGPLKYLQGKELLMYSPDLSQEEFYQVFAPEYKLFHEWNDLVGYLKSKNYRKYDIGIFHSASMQQGARI